MLRQEKIYRRLLWAWLMLWGFLIPSAFAAFPTASPVAEPFTPYEFQSTSTVVSTVGNPTFAPAMSRPYSGSPYSRPLKSGSWNPTDDNPVGNVDDPLPLGEPLILLVMGMLYALYHLLRVRYMRMRARAL